MAARENEIVPQPRKSLRSIRRSQLARMSGHLNPDSNIYSDEDEHPLWWKEIENNTVNLRGSHQSVYDSPVLNPNSDVEGTPLQKSWYKHLDQTTYSNRRSSVPRRQSRNAAADKSSRTSETSLTDDIIQKKRSKFHVKKGATRQPEFDTILNRMSESTRLSTQVKMSKYAVNKTDDESDSSTDNHSIKKTRRFPFKKPSKPIASLGAPGAQKSVTVFEDALDATIEEETGTKSKEVSNSISAKSSDIPIQPDVSALVGRVTILPTADRSTDTSAETAKFNLSKRRRMFTKKRKRISVNYENLWTSNEDNADVTASQKSGHTSTSQQKVEQIMPKRASKTDNPEVRNVSPILKRSYKRQKLSTPRMVALAPVEESLNTQIMEASDIDAITPSPPSPTINEANIEIAGRSRSKINKPQIRSIEIVQNELLKLKQRYDNDDSNESDEQISLVWRSSVKSNEAITPPKSTKALRTVDNREARKTPISPDESEDDHSTKYDDYAVTPLQTKDTPPSVHNRSEEGRQLSTLNRRNMANFEDSVSAANMEESDIDPITSSASHSTINEKDSQIAAKSLSRSYTHEDKVPDPEDSSDVQGSRGRSKSSEKSDDEGELDPVNLSSSHSPMKSRELRSLSRQTNISEAVNDSIREKHIDKRSRSVRDSLKTDTIYEKTASIDQPSRISNSMKSQKTMEAKKPAKIVQTAKTPKANKISKNIESGKEIEHSEPIEMDQSSKAIEANEAKSRELRSLSRQTNISEAVNDSIGEKHIDKRSRSVRDSLKMDTIYEKTASINQPSHTSKSIKSTKTMEAKKPAEIVETAKTPKANKISKNIESGKEIEHSEPIEMDQSSQVIEANEAKSRELRSLSRQTNVSEAVNDSIREKHIDKRSRSVRDSLKMDTIYEKTASIDQPSHTSKSIKSKKTMEAKKPAKIVQTAKTLEANKISKNIESGKEIEHSEPIEMDQSSRVIEANEAVEFHESVGLEGVTGTAKTANKPATRISRKMRKDKSIAEPSRQKNENLLSQLQSLSEHETDDKWEKAKRALEDVKKKQMASMKMVSIDTYFKAISKDKSVLAGYSQKSGKKPAQKARTVAKDDNSTLRNVNKAYIVNGQVYKRPKLPRPKQWVTDRLYKFFFKQLEPNFRSNTRVRAEKFVNNLSEAVSIITRRKKYDNYKTELNSLIEEMARLNLIKTLHDFHVFCQDFMPYDFRIKVVPMLLPGNVRNIPFHPAKLHEPILLEE